MRASIDITSIVILATSLQSTLAVSIGQIVPKSPIDISYGQRHSGYIASKVRREARAIVSGHEAYHVRNVAPSPSAVAVNIQPSASANPIPDVASWNNNTIAACIKAMDGMHGVASNPSGMAACYNVRQLDNGTGVFEADVRLFRVAPPSDGWTTQAITVGMSYLGAAVALERTGNAKRDGTIVSWPHEKRDATLPQAVQNLKFAGKVNDDLISVLKNETTSRKLLSPQIALSGKAQNGSTVTTELSTNDASFLWGVFADQTAANTTAAAAASASAAASGKFVLPGTTLGIFPTGLIITSVWTLLFVIIVGLGTVGRINFRDQYRRRIKAQQARQIRTI